MALQDFRQGFLPVLLGNKAVDLGSSACASQSKGPVRVLHVCCFKICAKQAIVRGIVCVNWNE